MNQEPYDMPPQKRKIFYNLPDGPGPLMRMLAEDYVPPTRWQRFKSWFKSLFKPEPEELPPGHEYDDWE